MARTPIRRSQSAGGLKFAVARPLNMRRPLPGTVSGGLLGALRIALISKD